MKTKEENNESDEETKPPSKKTSPPKQETKAVPAPHIKEPEQKPYSTPPPAPQSHSEPKRPDVTGQAASTSSAKKETLPIPVSQTLSKNPTPSPNRVNDLTKPAPGGGLFSKPANATGSATAPKTKNPLFG